MKRVSGIAPLALAALFCLAPLARAEGPRGPGGGPIHRLLEKLNLTDEQKAKIKDIRKAFEDANKDLRKSMRESRKALDDAMSGDAKKEDLINKYESMEGSKKRLDRARFEMMLDIRELLTSEQRKELRGMMKKGRPRRDKEEKED